MNLTYDEDFGEKIKQYNSSNGEPHIEVLWDVKKERWVIWVLAASVSTPNYNRRAHVQLVRPLPDGSGREGTKLVTWAQYDAQGHDIGYLPLDDRLFHSLRWADSFQSSRHFEEVVEEPAFQAQLAQKKDVRDIAYGARNYWWNLDKVAVGARTQGNWRRRMRR